MTRSIASIPQQGDLVGGLFRLGRELGRGSFGVVFEADQVDVGRRVAIKILQPKALARDDVAERFKREALLASSLTNAHSVAVYAFGVHGETATTQGLPYIAMEHLEGEDLYYYLARHPQLSPQETAAILHQALQSLAEAHQRGIIHRDLKPENLFLSRQGGEYVIKVLDFGIAKAIGEEWQSVMGQRLTAVGMVCGTPEFMAPEQASGELELTAAADVYAMGCIGFQMLSGQQPYQGNSPMDIAIKHMTEPIPELPAEHAWTELAAVIRRAMGKKPHERYRDAGEFARALEAAASAMGLALRLDREALTFISGEFLPYDEDNATQVARVGTDNIDLHELHELQVTEVVMSSDHLATEVRPVPKAAASSPSVARLGSADVTRIAPPPVRTRARAPRHDERHATALVAAATTRVDTRLPEFSGPDYGDLHDASTAVMRDPARLKPSPAPMVNESSGGSSRALIIGAVIAAVALLASVALTLALIWPAASTSEAPEVVRVSITSVPSGAEVWSGEERLGVTPWSSAHRGAWPLKLTLRKEGYATLPFELEAGGQGAVNRTLTLTRLDAPDAPDGEARAEAALEPETDEAPAPREAPTSAEAPHVEPGEADGKGAEVALPPLDTPRRAVPRRGTTPVRRREDTSATPPTGGQAPDAERIKPVDPVQLWQDEPKNKPRQR